MRKCLGVLIVLVFLLVPIGLGAEEESSLDLRIQLKEAQFDKLGWEKLFYIEKVKGVDVKRAMVMSELTELKARKVALEKAKEADKAKDEAERE